MSLDKLDHPVSLDHPAFHRSHIHLTHSRLVSK
jgi:hypothetical protein